MTATRRGCLEPRKPDPERHRCRVKGVAGKGKMVPLDGVDLNTLFDELAAIEDQLRPYKYELEELGL